MSTLPAELGLRCVTSFDKLDQILVAAVLEARLLRTPRLLFLRNGEIVVEAQGTIDWKRKVFITEGTDDDDDVINVGHSEDFQKTLIRKLRTFRGNVGKLARLHGADSADWSITLIDRDGKKAQSDVIRRRFNIGPLDAEGRKLRERFDDVINNEGGIRGQFGDKRIGGLGLTIRARKLPSNRKA
jgi:hypothetical protein